ncbi:MAG: hypothetical protein WCR04_08780 [Fibrobacteraceae bacterium]
MQKSIQRSRQSDDRYRQNRLRKMEEQPQRKAPASHQRMHQRTKQDKAERFVFVLIEQEGQAEQAQRFRKQTRDKARFHQPEERLSGKVLRASGAMGIQCYKSKRKKRVNKEAWNLAKNRRVTSRKPIIQRLCERKQADFEPKSTPKHLTNVA